LKEYLDDSKEIMKPPSPKLPSANRLAAILIILSCINLKPKLKEPIPFSVPDKTLRSIINLPPDVNWPLKYKCPEYPSTLSKENEPVVDAPKVLAIFDSTKPPETPIAMRDFFGLYFSQPRLTVYWNPVLENCL